MKPLSPALDRFIRFSDVVARETLRDVILAKPLVGSAFRHRVLQEARLAGVIDDNQTIDDLYRILADAGFHEEIIDEYRTHHSLLVRVRNE